jgi:hypothetical protein
MSHRASTHLENYVRTADLFMIRVTYLAALGLCGLLAVRKPLVTTYLGVAAIVAVLLAYSAFEVYPHLAEILGLLAPDYYLFKRGLIPDSELVYRPMPNLDVWVGIEHDVSDDEGFRNPSVPQSSDVVIIGDGMVNSGVSWQDSFGGRLQKHLPALSVRNLSVSGYGPPQYLKVLERYGIKRNPKIVILAYNEGGDLSDTTRYLDFKNSGIWPEYLGGYEAGMTDPVRKFKTAFSETWTYLQNRTWNFTEHLIATILPHRQLPLADYSADLELPNGRRLTTVFIGFQNTKPTQVIEEGEDWRQLEQILIQFKTLSAEHSITPVILFVPTASHIYAQYSMDGEGGPYWLQMREDQIRAKHYLESALRETSERLGITFLSLSTIFEPAAERGQMVYDTASVHINSDGLELAADYVAKELLPLP